MESQLAAYKALIIMARTEIGISHTALNSAVDSFEPLFFNNPVVVLDGYFVHPSRTLEKMDGNPLIEVAILCNSILQNHGVMSADKAIKFNPAKSNSKLQAGDDIKLTGSDLVLLFRVAEIETKFV